MQVVQTEDLRKVYKADGVAVHVLNGVNLEVSQGDFVSIMGPSGCGKSTLLHLLAGLDAPTGGKVIVVGQHLNGLNESRRAVLRRQTIGFVFQSYNLIPNLTVADNVDMPALLAGLQAKEITRRRTARLCTLTS